MFCQFFSFNAKILILNIFYTNNSVFPSLIMQFCFLILILLLIWRFGHFIRAAAYLTFFLQHNFVLNSNFWMFLTIKFAVDWCLYWRCETHSWRSIQNHCRFTGFWNRGSTEFQEVITRNFKFLHFSVLVQLLVVGSRIYLNRISLYS
jgi:hypothetical protein